MRSKCGARIGMFAILVVAFLGVSAGSASAHTIAGPRPTDYRSRIVSMNPEVPGIDVRVVDLGSKLELTNRTDRDVVVLGYVDEPYLRVGPTGVYENLHSQATYINRTRNGGSVPSNIDTNPKAPPEWHKISDGQTVRWHDHRIHWMGSAEPPVVAASPGRFHRLSVQDITLIHEPDQKIIVTAELAWVPGPAGWPWLPVAIGLFAVGLVVALLPRLRIALATLIGLLVVSDAAHAIAYEIPRPGGNLSKTLQFLGGGFVTVAVWIAAVFTIVGVLRKKPEALYGVVFVGVMVALVGGATDLAALWKSQLPNAGPPVVTRLEIVISLGLGAGMVVGALIRMIRSGRAADRDARGGRWLSLLVSDLSDRELERIARDLDADDVLDVAFRELAGREQPVADRFDAGSLVMHITAETLQGSDVHVWSLAADGSGGVQAARGRTDPVAAELYTTLPVMLRLLAGVLAYDAATTSGLATGEGDPTFIAAVAAYLPEDAVSPTPDEASAS